MILVVDDDEDTRDSMKMLLELYGFTVHTAKHGQEALHKISKRRPELILVDFRMPVMDGLSFCEFLKDKESTRDIPIFVISGDNRARKDFQDLGIDFFLKPVDLGTITNRITLLLTQ